ncbi:MAG: acyltransferase family protein, partial [Eubacterium sp.]|nr:acyltransferase family protein [Eubacterium sp.]
MAIKEKTDIGAAQENAAVLGGDKKALKAAKPRMLEQDIAKGIAIILVMALHTLTLSKEIYNILGGLFGFIMPFYFFMAGYNHRPNRYTYKEIIRKRMKQIGIPFINYSISITLISGAYYMIAQGY